MKQKTATKKTPVHPRNCSIAKFVADRGLARQTYYNLKKRGLAPVTLHVLGRRIITPQAVLDWEAKMAALTVGAR